MFGGFQVGPFQTNYQQVSQVVQRRGGIDDRRREKLAQIQRDDEDLLTLAAMVVSRIPWD